MIRQVTTLPPLREPSAEGIRLHCLFDCYGDSLPFWEQNDGQAYLSLADGDMTVWGDSDFAELREFLGFLDPASLFASAKTLSALDLPGGKTEPLWVLSGPTEENAACRGDTLKSDELYEILKQGGFFLPAYPAFAVDICRRLNHGGAGVYAKRGKGAAVWFQTGSYRLLTGLVSFQKGFGTEAVKAVLRAGPGKQVVVCCREHLIGFYQNNGFQKQYQAGSWLHS